MSANLRKRILSAVVLGTIFLVLVFFKPISLTLAFLLMAAVAVFEFHRMMNAIHKAKFEWHHVLSLSLVVVLFILSFVLGHFNNHGWMLLSLAALLFTLLRSFWFEDYNLKRAFGDLTGMIYIGVPIALLIIMAIHPEKSGGFNPHIVLIILLLIWANDICAYFVGKRFGKRKLAPKISPNKTWEGFFGGAAGSILTALILSVIYAKPIIILFGLVIAIVGPIGDLVESSLKRRSGIKDSANTIPGHGGVLDRFDAFIFSIPFVFIVWMMFWV